MMRLSEVSLQCNMSRNKWVLGRGRLERVAHDPSIAADVIWYYEISVPVRLGNSVK